MLVEVVDEQPARDVDEERLGLEAELLEHLVAHYSQPIHIPSEHSAPHFELNECSVSSVVKYCYEKLLQQDINDRTQTIRNLMALYPTLIRPSLFSPERTVQTTGVAVLYHYDWLLSLLCDNTTTWDGNSRRQISLSGKKNRHAPDVDEELTEAVRRLMSDVSICVSAAVHSMVPSENADETAAITRTFNHLRRYVIPASLRLWNKMLASPRHETLDDNVTCQSTTRLLAWSWLRVEPVLVAPSLQHALSAPGLAEPQPYTPASNKLPKYWQGLDWTRSVEFVSERWNTETTQRFAVTHWNCSTNSNDMRQCQKATCERLGWNVMAAAIRRHFFGKDDAAMDEETATVKTRLHLGRTVPEEPVEYEKPYRAVPSRMHAACVFISLLEHVTANILQDLAPILYEILAAPRESIQAMGAVCLYQLLYISKGLHSVWSPVILSNLTGALDLAVQTCRTGSVVALLGVTQVALLRRLPHQDALKQRCKASQQWLMILNKNLHNQELVWGILAGGVVPFGKDHAHSPDNEGLELGRLALSCLLPLIRRDTGTATASTETMAHEITWLAVVALTHWLVAAHAVMTNHGGKLIGSLLSCLARTAEEDSAVFIWAKHATAMVVVATNPSAPGDKKRYSVLSPKLNQIIEAGFFQERLASIAKQVLHDAEDLADNLKQEYAS